MNLSRVQRRLRQGCRADLHGIAGLIGCLYSLGERAAAIESQTVGAFEQRTLSEHHRFGAFAICADHDLPDRAARGVRNMQYTVGIKRDTIGDDLLLRLAVGKRAHVLVDLHRRFGCTAIRTDAIDDAAGAAADEKISLPVKGDAIRARRDSL